MDVRAPIFGSDGGPTDQQAFNKTVLQIVPELDSGGAERSTVEIAIGVVQAGGRAIVASRGGRLVAELEASGVDVRPLPVHSKNPATILANALRVRQLIEEEDVDIVHVRSRAPAWSALIAARAAGRPLVSTYHGAYDAKGPLKRLYNSAMVRADLIIANSEFTAKSIRAQYKIDAERLRVIPRGADLSVFDPGRVPPQRVAGLARAWGLDAAWPGLKLLLPARLTFWKGQDIAIRAVERLLKEPPIADLSGPASTGQGRGLQLVFAGDAQGSGEFGRALRREAEARGVRDMVHFVGHCADMPAAYLWADIVLSPATLPEAFGRVAIEAGAMGRPTIVSDLGGQRETVIDGRTGLVTPPGDEIALADAIREFAGMSSGARREMGQSARERVVARFSGAAMRRSTIGVYRELTVTG